MQWVMFKRGRMIGISKASAWALALLLVVTLCAHAKSQVLAAPADRPVQSGNHCLGDGVGLVNRLQQMQLQMQQMQGQIEELQHRLRQFKMSQASQYKHLDTRVDKLEHVRLTPVKKPIASGLASHSKHVRHTLHTKKVAALRPANAVMRRAYTAALKSLRAGHYLAASRGFRTYIQTYPNTSLTPNAVYWLGESYYAMHHYRVAIKAFKYLLSHFPDSAKAPGARLKLGYAQFELKQMASARATLKSVLANYPGSHVATLARRRLHQIH